MPFKIGPVEFDHDHVRGNCSHAPCVAATAELMAVLQPEAIAASNQAVIDQAAQFTPEELAELYSD